MRIIERPVRDTTSFKALYGKKAAPVLEPNDEYPQKWREYIGQEPAVKMLQVAAASARLRKQPLDHILITHPSPGIGKTALATLVGRELRRPVRLISGKVTAQKARMVLSEMEDRDVLIYDEFHRVAEGSRTNAEWLLHLLQDGVLMGPLGAETQPKITLIAATTNPQKVPQAVLDRFMLVPPMQDYSTAEAARIAQLMGPRYLDDLPKLIKREATLLASAAGNNPRSIKRLLTSLRDMTITKSLPLHNGRFDIRGLLAWHGITEDGLSPVAQQYLRALAFDFGGSAGVKALEERLQQPGGLTEVERALMDRGLVARTRTGRSLTQTGITRSRQLAG